MRVSSFTKKEDDTGNNQHGKYGPQVAMLHGTVKSKAWGVVPKEYDPHQKKNSTVKKKQFCFSFCEEKDGQ